MLVDIAIIMCWLGFLLTLLYVLIEKIKIRPGNYIKEKIVYVIITPGCKSVLILWRFGYPTTQKPTLSFPPYKLRVSQID